jgi:aldehyde dehydrogenase
MLAVAETWDNGKPVRETLAADLPLAVDHFRYYAGALRAQEGHLSQIDENTVAYHFHEPLGGRRPDHPLELPDPHGGVGRSARPWPPVTPSSSSRPEQTPASILVVAELIADLLPDGVLNIVNGLGEGGGARRSPPPTASPRSPSPVPPRSERSSTRPVAEKLIPVTLELGGKSPNIFFGDVMDADDSFRQKTLEGFSMFALNQGEVCTCPSRALVQESIADEFLELAVDRVRQVKVGNPLDPDTMIGAQASLEQMDKISSYLRSGPEEGAEVLIGGSVRTVEGLENGFYVEPTVLKGSNNMRCFQEEIFGPVLAVTTFKDFDDAIAIANDTDYGLGAGVWARDGRTAYQAGRAIQSGRVWVNNYHSYPAHAAFGGYKKSGIGRETPPDDAGPLPADEEPALVVRREPPTVFSDPLSRPPIRVCPGRRPGSLVMGITRPRRTIRWHERSQ